MQDRSVLLQLPNSIEEIPVNADHSNLVKFETAGNSTYREVRMIIGQMLLDAPAVRQSRFIGNFPIHFSVPFARNERYIGRWTNYVSIRDKLSGTEGSGRHQRLALWGLGGTGKTQDILNYVYEFQGRVSVFWIYAGSRAHFEQGYRKLAVLLQLAGYDDVKTDIRPAVKSWFESPASGSWILVLDNADNMLDFYPRMQRVNASTENDDKDHGLAQFVPHGSKGTVILTTRDLSVAETLSGGNVLSKGAMNADEALKLFRDRYQNAHGDGTSAILLVEELQYLPLAIVQAAAYLRQNRLLSPSGYLQQFKVTKRDLLSKPFRDLRRESGSAGAETILATFAVTFEQIQSHWPLAWSFLEIMACIGRQGIPGDLLRQSVPDGLGINAADEALAKLIDFAFITQAAIGEGTLFVLHALVHVSIQEFICTRETMPAAMKKTGEILRKILPNEEHENWSGWTTYLSHALAWAANTPILSEDTAAIYFVMSSYLRSIGRYNEAEDKAKASANIRISILGAEHPQTLNSIAKLAHSIYGLRRSQQAITMMTHAFVHQSAKLGSNHPDTKASQRTLRDWNHVLCNLSSIQRLDG